MAEITHIARLIKSARTDHGISQEQLAEMTGLAGPYITAIEKGRRIPSPEKAEAIARALHLDVEAVLDAIFLSKHPTVQIRSPQPRHGWFVEVTEIEQRQVEKFARLRGWKDTESFLRRVLLDFVNDNR